MKTRKCILLWMLLFQSLYSVGQNETFSSQIINAKTNNSKETTTEYFQALAKNINSSNGEYTFKMTLFGLRVLNDSSLLIDSKYLQKQNTIQRHFEIQAGMKAESGNEFTQVTAGFNFAIIDKRDISVQVFSDSSMDMLHEMMSNARRLFAELNSQLSQEQQAAENKKLKDSFDLFKKSKNSKDLYGPFREILQNEKNKINGFKSLSIEEAYWLQEDAYKSFSKLVARKPLWTFGANLIYDVNDENISEFHGNTHFLMGLGKNPGKKPLEIDFEAEMNMSDDSTKENNDIDKIVLNGSLGLNKVWMENRKSESVGEFKLAVGYEYNLAEGISNNDRGILTLESELRLRVSKQVWIPLTVKYDVENANVFGLLNVTWDFDFND